MFRRFMIVCWVLFSLGAGTGLVGWAGYEYYARQAAELVAQAQKEYESETDKIPESQRDPPKVGDIVMGKDYRKYKYIGGDPSDKNNWEILPLQKKLSLASTGESRDLERKGEPFLGVSIIGGLLAGAMLLWNIIWHTGHWVWMGRKEQ